MTLYNESTSNNGTSGGVSGLWLQDANGLQVWAQNDGTGWVYTDSPGGAAVTPVQPFSPLSPGGGTPEGFAESPLLPSDADDSYLTKTA